MCAQHIIIRTRAVVFDDRGRVLVQHHSRSPPDFYRLPGGGVRFREKLEDCLVREIEEEAGFKSRVERLLWVRDFWEDSSYHSIEFFFLAKVLGGTFTPTPEGENIELLFMTLEELEKVVFYPTTFLPKLKRLRDDRSWAEENPYVRTAN